MNYIRHLTGFYDRVQADYRLNPTHISLYLALFQFWNLNRFQNPISISRGEMMRLSKISALGTYHKCIKQLQEFGYIEYMPSFNPYKGSLVNLLNFDEQPVRKGKDSPIIKSTPAEQELNGHPVKIDTSTEQALIPSTNNKNYSNNKHSRLTTQKNTVISSAAKQTNEADESFKNPKQKEKIVRLSEIEAIQYRVERSSSHFYPPPLTEVKLFFEEKEVPLEEAEKFFNHYESNGWLVGGKSKMKNWQAAARNWLLNAKKFNSVIASTAKQSNTILKPNHLNTSTHKNYTDPL